MLLQFLLGVDVLIILWNKITLNIHYGRLKAISLQKKDTMHLNLSKDLKNTNSDTETGELNIVSSKCTAQETCAICFYLTILLQYPIKEKPHSKSLGIVIFANY